MTTNLLRAAAAAILLTGLTLSANPADAASTGSKDKGTCQGQRVTIKGTGKANRIRGTSGRDVISGLGGNDAIKGGGGNDVICGGAGQDTVSGDAGNDNIDGGSGTDVVHGGAGNDLIRSGSGKVGLLWGEDGNDVIVAQDGGIGLLGGPGDDVLSTTYAGTLLRGDEGRDTLTGGQFADVVEGGADADRIVTLGGADTIEAGEGKDEVDAGAGTDTVDGGAGDDTIHGGADPDVLRGGADEDVIEAGDGNDHCLGGEGHDVCDGGTPGESRANTPEDPDICETEEKISCRGDDKGDEILYTGSASGVEKRSGGETVTWSAAFGTLSGPSRTNQRATATITWKITGGDYCTYEGEGTVSGRVLLQETPLDYYLTLSSDDGASIPVTVSCPGSGSSVQPTKPLSTPASSGRQPWPTDRSKVSGSRGPISQLVWGWELHG